MISTSPELREQPFTLEDRTGAPASSHGSWCTMPGRSSGFRWEWVWGFRLFEGLPGVRAATPLRSVLEVEGVGIYIYTHTYIIIERERGRCIYIYTYRDIDSVELLVSGWKCSGCNPSGRAKAVPRNTGYSGTCKYMCYVCVDI